MTLVIAKKEHNWVWIAADRRVTFWGCIIKNDCPKMRDMWNFILSWAWKLWEIDKLEVLLRNDLSKRKKKFKYDKLTLVPLLQWRFNESEPTEAVIAYWDRIFQIWQCGFIYEHNDWFLTGDDGADMLYTYLLREWHNFEYICSKIFDVTSERRAGVWKEHDIAFIEKK